MTDPTNPITIEYLWILDTSPFTVNTRTVPVGWNAGDEDHSESVMSFYPDLPVGSAIHAWMYWRYPLGTDLAADALVTKAFGDQGQVQMKFNKLFEDRHCPSIEALVERISSLFQPCIVEYTKKHVSPDMTSIM